jgi:serine/threonine protein kinase
VAGGELFDRICDKTVYTEAEARSLVVTLLTTLNYLHKKKIAHRDLKPENLLLRSKDDDTDIVLAGKYSQQYRPRPHHILCQNLVSVLTISFSLAV